MKLYLLIVLVAICSGIRRDRHFGRGGRCNPIVIGFRENIRANIRASCNSGNIEYHYTTTNLPIVFNRPGEYRVCFVIGEDYRGGPKVSFQNFEEESSQERRVRRFCRNLNADRRTVIAIPRSTYYMVSMRYSITDLSSNN